MEKVELYEASDGALFKEKYPCECHERELAFISIYEHEQRTPDARMPDNISAKDMIEWLKQHEQDILTLFNVLTATGEKK